MRLELLRRTVFPFTPKKEHDGRVRLALSRVSGLEHPKFEIDLVDRFINFGFGVCEFGWIRGRLRECVVSCQPGKKGNRYQPDGKSHGRVFRNELRSILRDGLLKDHRHLRWHDQSIAKAGTEHCNLFESVSTDRKF